MSGIGYKAIVGIAKQSAFETAVGATDKGLLISEGIKDTPAFVDHDYLQGVARIVDTQNVFNPAGGSIELAMSYTAISGAAFVGASLLIAAAMGTCAWSATPKSNQITLLDDLNIFLTLAFFKGLTGITWESVGTMVNSMTLGCAAGESMKATFELITGELVKNTAEVNGIVDSASSTQITATASIFVSGDVGKYIHIGTEARIISVVNASDTITVTPAFSSTPSKNDTFVITAINSEGSLDLLPDTIPELMTFNQMTFRIGDHSDALGDGDRVCISSFELSLNNNLTSDEQASPCAENSDAKTQIQPVRNGFREVTLSIEMPRYNADTFQTWKAANTALQSDIIFTDGTSSFKIFLPNLEIIDSGAALAGAGAVKQTVTFKALAWISTSDLTFTDGSTTNAGELWIETIDGRTAKIF